MGEHSHRATAKSTAAPVTSTSTAAAEASAVAASTTASRRLSSTGTTTTLGRGEVVGVAGGSSRGPLNAKDARELFDIRNLLWGPTIRADVFRRWSQGFEFSDVEPSALVQKQGGPCAVIAPVQAYLLKILIMDTPGHCLKDLTEDKCKRLLIQALCNILTKCKASHYRIVTVPLEQCMEAKETIIETTQTSSGDMKTPDNNPATHPPAPNESRGANAFEWTPDEFHRQLQVLQFGSIDQVEKYYMENFNVLSAQYGVLLFMYTVFLTKGIENVNSELSDTSEPLIHTNFGYGSQGLINLMLTGRAVAHVWDNDQDVGGLKLRGINEQSDIGFITLMEQMRYCTVGSFFKNPRNPVWVMGSETHLTVLFSTEKRLVSPETPSEIARRVFKSYDPDGNNFIPTAVLQDVLSTLDLVSEPEYVEIMQKRLDPEGLGIILLNAFMDEFFPLERRSTPDTFDLMHYNGIPGANEGNKVRYYKGSAILLESDLKSVCVSNPMLTCLQTKWPSIEINWHDMRIPSLN